MFCIYVSFSIDAWMGSKMNADKTQLMWLGTRQQLDKLSVTELSLLSAMSRQWLTISASSLTAS